MTIYCNDPQYDSSEVFINGVSQGVHTAPVDVEVIKVGEPYAAHANRGILGGRQAWQTTRYDGFGVPLGTFVIRDQQLNISFNPPSTESGLWLITWQTASVWFDQWIVANGSSDSIRFERYKVIINGTEIALRYQLNPAIEVVCTEGCEQGTEWNDECNDCVPICFDMFLQYLQDWNNSF
jgi:hypothetical protein